MNIQDERLDFDGTLGGEYYTVTGATDNSRKTFDYVRDGFMPGVEYMGSSGRHNLTALFYDVNLEELGGIIERLFARHKVKFLIKSRLNLPSVISPKSLIKFGYCGLVLDNVKLSSNEFSELCEWQFHNSKKRSLSFYEEGFAARLDHQHITLNQRSMHDSETLQLARILLKATVWNKKGFVPYLKFYLSNSQHPFIKDLLSVRMWSSRSVKTEVSCLRTFQLYLEENDTVYQKITLADSIISENYPENLKPDSSVTSAVFHYRSVTMERLRKPCIGKVLKYCRIEKVVEINIHSVQQADIITILNDLVNAGCLAKISTFSICAFVELDSPRSFSTSGSCAFISLLLSFLHICKKLTTLKIAYYFPTQSTRFLVNFLSSLFNFSRIERWILVDTSLTIEAFAQTLGRMNLCDAEAMYGTTPINIFKTVKY